ncbi:transporter substrate-binding domain-containing protein [Rhodoferax sp. GW822-FHT02A01]|uniref:transporter substrate-binding domain-containing protein n=1 Tax=Rhodoferax sp. GW822-FHT02A01 TaxID=3141537 RepID=UPI00315CD491
MSLIQVIRFAGLFVANVGCALAQSVPIHLLYAERPPFMSRSLQGEVIGITATPAIQAFVKAGIAYELIEASPARRLLEIRENKDRVCSIGLYKTQERESYGKFTKPISQDSAMVGFANASFHPPKGVSLDAILADANTTVLIKNAIVYGPYLEQKFVTMKAIRMPTSAEYGQLIKMIQLDRSKLTFLPYEEVMYYARQEGFKESDFNIIHFKGMPAGEMRYVMCSMSVEDETIARLNSFIRN